MRLIDADALMKDICSSVKEMMDMNIVVDAHDLWDKLYYAWENAPSLDLVKYGHWIDIDSESYTWKVRCSECGHERSMMSTQGKYPKYCEECGAKIIEEAT